MQKHLVGLPVFLFAFFVSCSVVVIQPFKESLSSTSTFSMADDSIPAVSLLSVRLPAPQPAETPEFKNLPNNEDIEYPDSTQKLVDILQRDAVYRESEVVAKTGETWITLYEQGDDYILKNTKATVRKKHTISYPGDEYDVHLSFDKPGFPIFAVKNIRSIKPGKVTSLYLRPSWREIDRRGLDYGTMGKAYNREFNLNEKKYTLRQSTGLTKSGDTVCVLVLEIEGTSQVIAQNYGDDIGDLLWVGDLDNDGKLDVYFDEANEKGYFSVGLYLSSEAEAGKLVKLSAVFGTAGC